MTAPAFVTLRNLSDIRVYFAHRKRPVYFIGATNFNLMGLHEWVGDWHDINLIDCFDGGHPNVQVVNSHPSQTFNSAEAINHYLLLQPEVISRVKSRASDNGQAIFLFFDETLETRCTELGLQLMRPPYHLVRDLDSKITTTRIGNEVGVDSVPNVMAEVRSYAELQSIATAAGLGERWVVQCAYGDSGKTTFFIASPADYDAVADQIEIGEPVKVMRWLRCVGTAIEACATRWGTFVGPLMTELIGVPALTPYAGGWCGNELYEGAFTPQQREEALQKTEALGNALYARGYRGYFEVDFLVDLDTGKLYLGELNPRISGISAMTNLSDFSQSHVPLFLFHLLEYDDAVNLDMDVRSFNLSVLQGGASGVASQMVLKYTADDLQVLTHAPASGVYTLDAEGHLTLKKVSFSRRDALGQSEVFVLRIMRSDEWIYPGADLAIVFLNQEIRQHDGKLTPFGQQWAGAMRAAFLSRPLTAEERTLVQQVHAPAGVKSAGA